jgi:hypothetical protein
MTKQLALIPEDQLSDAMKALNPKQRAFAVALFDYPDAHYEAARVAGYEGTKEYRSMQASRLCSNEKVQAALREIALSRNVLMVPGALKAVKEITEDVGHKDRLRAATNTLSRAGLDAPARSEVSVDLNVAWPTMTELQKIAEFAKWANEDPAFAAHFRVDKQNHPDFLKELVEGPEGVWRVEPDPKLAQMRRGEPWISSPAAAFVEDDDFIELDPDIPL